jgi:hypothetical protein
LIDREAAIMPDVVDDRDRDRRPMHEDEDSSSFGLATLPRVVGMDTMRRSILGGR